MDTITTEQQDSVRKFVLGNKSGVSLFVINKFFRKVKYYKICCILQSTDKSTIN